MRRGVRDACWPALRHRTRDCLSLCVPWYVAWHMACAWPAQSLALILPRDACWLLRALFHQTARLPRSLPPGAQPVCLGGTMPVAGCVRRAVPFATPRGACLSFPFLSFCFLYLSFPCLSFRLRSSPFLSFPFLFFPLLSFRFLSCPVLSFAFPFFSIRFLSCPVHSVLSPPFRFFPLSFVVSGWRWLARGFCWLWLAAACGGVAGCARRRPATAGCGWLAGGGGGGWLAGWLAGGGWPPCF